MNEVKITGEAKARMFAMLSKYLPENSVHYCFDLWTEHPFHFRVSRERGSKLGDYRYDPRYDDDAISVNHNLNSYSFLITYIHEVAHLITRITNKKRVLPHGREWKSNFQKLMLPMLNDLVFPPDVLKALTRYMRDPKASTHSDPNLIKMLRTYDAKPAGERCLDEIGEGETFSFKGMVFKKLTTKRTRALCCHVPSGNRYLIPKIAWVHTANSEE
jgi:SprT protein